MYIRKCFTSLYLEIGKVKTSSRYDQARPKTTQSTVEQLGKDLKERIQYMEKKFSELQKYLSIRDVDLKNMEQEMIRVGEIANRMEECLCFGEDAQDERPLRARKGTAGLADRTQKGNGQRYGERQTCEGSTMDGKLILHEIV